MTVEIDGTPATGSLDDVANGVDAVDAGLEVIVDARSGRFLGHHILGHQASGLRAVAAIAIEFCVSDERSPWRNEVSIPESPTRVPSPRQPSIPTASR